MDTMGVGFALLGTSNVKFISDNDADDIFNYIKAAGINRFDTAPLYGGGLSEERLGKLLKNIDRKDFILSTKVGRYRPYSEPIKDPKNNTSDWYDYSAGTTEKSIFKSLERLNTDYLDIVFIHDCDNYINEAIKYCLPVLYKLKSQGIIKRIGCGSNFAITHEKFLDKTEIDILMVAGRYTLLDQSANKLLFAKAIEKSVEVELASPFNSGILASGTKDKKARFDYLPATEEVFKKVKKIEEICDSYNISIKCASLNYSLSHPAVKRLILGLVGQEGLQSNISDLDVKIPYELWQDLSEIGIQMPIEGC